MRNKIILCLTFVIISLFATPTVAQSHDISNGPIFEGDEEVVYFFSYHCATCFDAHSYLSMWSAMQEKRIRRVPLLGPNDEWEFGARLFFILGYAKNKFPLSDFEREKAAYQIVLNMEEYPQTASEFMAVLREYGLQFNSTEFLSWWRNSELMLASVEEIIDSQKDSLANPPSLRVHANGKTSWVRYSPFSIEPGFQMLKELNSKL